MKFVGIRNSLAKRKVLQNGVFSIRTQLSLDLSYDCIRHIDFLRLVNAGMVESEYQETLYWKYILLKGGSPEKAIFRARQLRDLFLSVQQGALKPSESYGAVTEDGIRIDGSHRAAIATVLGISSLAVQVYSWEEHASRTEIAAILEETRVKREAQDAYLGKRAYSPKGKLLIGTVAFVDVWPERRLWHIFSSTSWRPVVVIKTQDGGLVEHAVDQVILGKD